MGFDLYGINPTVNKEYPPRYNQIMKEYGKDGWIDWTKNVPEDVKEEYFELKQQFEENNPGDYFRNNVWYWRPLWSFVSHHCMNILTEKDISGGTYNDGHKISKTKSLKIAKKLSQLIADGTVAHYEKEYRLGYEEAQVWNEEVNEMLKDIKARVKLKFGKEMAPVDYPAPFKSEWDKTYGKKNYDGHYPFSADNVEEFAKFCQQSGGFTIC